MFRRTFVALACLAPFAALADPLDYTPGLVNERLAAGETVFLEQRDHFLAVGKLANTFGQVSVGLFLITRQPLSNAGEHILEVPRVRCFEWLPSRH